MTHSRNDRRKALRKRTHTSGQPAARMAKATEYHRFWTTTEPSRRAQRLHDALLRARDHDDARRARKGLKPRDAFWQRIGAVRR